MKKTLGILCMAAMVTMFGCKKDETEETKFDNKVFVQEIFNAGMMWNAQGKALKSSYHIYIDVDNTVTGIEGGTIHVLGNVSGNMNIDDQTGAITGGTMLLGLTETINDFTLTSDGKTFTINGAPYISLAGTFTLQPGGSTFGTASSMEIGGGYRVTGDGYDQTVNVQLTIIINTNGTGGTVSGNINGVAVHYTL
ncbi:MAG TPA: hypothetical protein PLJ84_11120 [Bacteroidales bacterium]|nr:hypothetical protein [Bacteroidales bacterium]HPT03138.1 hypothetical protein [Bacteroidales bacterium]